MDGWRIRSPLLQFSGPRTVSGNPVQHMTHFCSQLCGCLAPKDPEWCCGASFPNYLLVQSLSANAVLLQTVSAEYRLRLIIGPFRFGPKWEKRCFGSTESDWPKWAIEESAEWEASATLPKTRLSIRQNFFALPKRQYWISCDSMSNGCIYCRNITTGSLLGCSASYRHKRLTVRTSICMSRFIPDLSSCQNWYI